MSAYPQIEQLTRQFYEWECRGRGWLVWDEPVRLEPPHRPVYYRMPAARVPDDVRQAGFGDAFKELFSWMFGGGSSQTAVTIPDQADGGVPEEEPQELYVTDESRQPLTEHRLLLPADCRITKELSSHLLLSLSSIPGPVAFEIVATSHDVAYQFACRAPHGDTMVQHCRAYLPDASVTSPENTLHELWDSRARQPCLAADFGLSEEFVRPIRTFNSFDVDPLLGVVSALNALQGRELAVFQVLFEPCRHPWAQNIVRAVTSWDGDSFFLDAPEMVNLAREKIAQPLYAAVVRAAAWSEREHRVWDILRDISGGLSQFDNPASNELIPLTNDEYPDWLHIGDVLDRRTRRSGMILNAEELVGFVHPPSPSVRAERLARADTHSKSAPSIVQEGGLALGVNIHEGERVEVRLNDDQRTRHMYAVGASGTGKSTFLLNLIEQDLAQDQGAAVLDPHGDLIDEVLPRIPEHRLDDVVIFDPADEAYPIGFNILAAHSDLERNLLASDLVAIFQRFSSNWGDQMTTVLSNAVLAFLESDRGGTLFDLRRFLVEKAFRAEFLKTVHNESVVYYWQREFPMLSGRPQAPILTRLDAFLRLKLVRHIVSQQKNRLDFAEMMDRGKIFLARLSQGAIGEENAYLFGSLLVSKFHQTALARQSAAAGERRPFFLYMDEFHNFLTPSMASLLTGVRKYRLGLVMAHQELRQLEKRDPEVAHAVLANPYTRVCFRVGEADAKKLAEGMKDFEPDDLLNLGTGQAVVRIEQPKYTFNLDAPKPEPVDPLVGEERRRQAVEASRSRYATPQADVEAWFAEQWKPKAEQPTVEEPQEEAAYAEGSSEPATEPEPSAEPTPEPKPRARPKRPKPPSPEPAPMGKGGSEHKYLQQLIKRWAEGMGYRATIEKQLDDACSVDVALEKDGLGIACEISVSTSPEHELANIEKCLKAGFARVAIIASERKKLNAVRAKAQEAFDNEQLDRVQFLTAEDLFAYIESFEAGKGNKEETVCGYRVKVNYQPIDAEEKVQRKNAVSQVILKAMARMKGKR